jgi:hypothetical protein
MPVVRDFVSALNKLAHAAHARLPAAGSPLRGEAPRAGRVIPAARVRVRWPEPGAEGPYVHGGVEPPLEEVLRDPIVRALMHRDGVRAEEIQHPP